MRTGNDVIWRGRKYTILAELDSEYVYLIDQQEPVLVHVSELQVVQ